MRWLLGASSADVQGMPRARWRAIRATLRLRARRWRQLNRLHRRETLNRLHRGISRYLAERIILNILHAHRIKCDGSDLFRLDRLAQRLIGSKNRITLKVVNLRNSLLVFCLFKLLPLFFYDSTTKMIRFVNKIILFTAIMSIKSRTPGEGQPSSERSSSKAMSVSSSFTFFN
jgi:hypothetical protein